MSSEMHKTFRWKTWRYRNCKKTR